MKQNESQTAGTTIILRYTFILLLMLWPALSNGQSAADFSGVWLQDITKSDDFYRSFDVKFTITQTPQTISIKQTFSDKSGNDVVERDYSFTLDGKVKTKEEEGGVSKELAQWSSDKKILTTRSTRTYGSEEVGSTSTYSLSDNGLILTVQTSDIKEGGLSVKQVFNKKQ